MFFPIAHSSFASTALATLTIQGSTDIKDLVLLMLVGPPGAGKSTVCQKIIQSAARPWTRVCQVCYISLKHTLSTTETCFEIAGS